MLEGNVQSINKMNNKNNSILKTVAKFRRIPPIKWKRELTKMEKFQNKGP